MAGVWQTWSASAIPKGKLVKALCASFGSKKRDGSRTFTRPAKSSTPLSPGGGPGELIIRRLASVATALDAGDYEDKKGVNSVAIVGPKGIGKTTALRAFAALCPVVLPNVVPVYVTFEDVSTKNFLSIIMAAALERHGVETRGRPTVDLYHVQHALAAADKTLLLLVDELDRLYQHKGQGARACLVDLAYIASDVGIAPSGRIACVVTGSSSVLPALITKTAIHVPSLREEYPLVVDAPNLIHKYQMYVLEHAPDN